MSLLRICPALSTGLIAFAFLIASITLNPSTASAQDTLRDVIFDMIAEVSSDNIIEHLQILEDAGGTRNRVTFTPGKDSAAVYIKKVFDSFPGLTSVEFDTFYIPNAAAPYNTQPQVNVIATLTGSVYPDEYYVIGAHFDAVADRDPAWNNGHAWQTIDAPGANDNGSGVAAILEMARIMSDASFPFEPERTIKFVAFGAEERLPAVLGTGNHHGSRHMARQARENSDNLLGMVSVDMIGYNPNNLYTAIVKVNNDMANASAMLGAKYVQANQNFFTNLIMNQFPFANGNYSDHLSFANEGYPAILVIENAAPWNSNQYYSANPFYHMQSDTYDRINIDLVRRVAQMNIAAMTTEVGTFTSVDERADQQISSLSLHQNYPNPFNPSTTIRFELPVSGHVNLEVYDALGNRIRTITNQVLPAGEHSMQFNADGLSSGMYIYRLMTDSQQLTRTMLLVR